MAIYFALLNDDPRLIQGATTLPPPLICVQEWPVESCCLIAYGAWQGGGLKTVAEVEERFAQVCFQADSYLQEPAGCRWFLNWYDDMPRASMREQLLAEVVEELALYEWNPPTYALLPEEDAA